MCTGFGILYPSLSQPGTVFPSIPGYGDPPKSDKQSKLQQI